MGFGYLPGFSQFLYSGKTIKLLNTLPYLQTHPKFPHKDKQMTAEGPWVPHSRDVVRCKKCAVDQGRFAIWVYIREASAIRDASETILARSTDLPEPPNRMPT